MANPTIRSFEDGTVRSITFWDKDGKSHRVNGPAQTEYWGNGNVRWMAWNIHNKQHRLDGPAYIYYDEQGNLDGKFWYAYGVKIDDMSDWTSFGQMF